MVIATWLAKISTGAQQVLATSPPNVLGPCPGTKDFLGHRTGKKKLNVH